MSLTLQYTAEKIVQCGLLSYFCIIWYPNMHICIAEQILMLCLQTLNARFAALNQFRSKFCNFSVSLQVR